MTRAMGERFMMGRGVGASPLSLSDSWLFGVAFEGTVHEAPLPVRCRVHRPGPLKTALFSTHLPRTPRPSQCVSCLPVPESLRHAGRHTASSGDGGGAFWKTHFPGGNCHCSYRS